MTDTNQPATITVRIDQLIDVLQDLLMAKASECREALDEPEDSQSQLWREQLARDLFEQYADGVVDSANALGEVQVGGILRAFASTELATFPDSNERS